MRSPRTIGHSCCSIMVVVQLRPISAFMGQTTSTITRVSSTCFSELTQRNYREIWPSWQPSVRIGFRMILPGIPVVVSCLGVSGDRIGQIFFWDMEHEAADGQAPGYDNVFWVADSFQSLLDNLYLDG